MNLSSFALQILPSGASKKTQSELNAANQLGGTLSTSSAKGVKRKRVDDAPLTPTSPGTTVNNMGLPPLVT